METENVLEKEIVQLTAYAAYLKTRKRAKQIDTKELEQTLIMTRTTMGALQTILSAYHQVEPIHDYLEQMIKVINSLQGVVSTELKRYPAPNEFLRGTATTFESFANRVTSRETRRRLAKAAQWINIVDGLVPAFSGILYYFEYANKYEKAIMIFSTVLLLTALALTISIYASPVIAAIPFLWYGVSGMAVLSKIMFDQSSANAKRQYNTLPKLQAANKELQEKLTTMEKLYPCVQSFTDEAFATFGHGVGKKPQPLRFNAADAKSRRAKANKKTTPLKSSKHKNSGGGAE